MKKAGVNQEYSVAMKGEEIKEGTRGSRVATIFVNSFFTLSIILSISLVAFSVIFFLSIVEGPSMMTTINAGYDTDKNIKDSVLVNRYAAPQRGDIIITKYYWSPDPSGREFGRYKNAANTDSDGRRYDHFVKRLIAIEGDTIKFVRRDDGSYVPIYDVFLTKSGETEAELLNETYLDPHWGKIAYWDHYYQGFNVEEDRRGYVSFELTVPEGKIFFMGDNRGSTSYYDYQIHSYDCREFGPQPRENLLGTVKEVIPEQVSMPEYVFHKIGDLFTFNKN